VTLVALLPQVVDLDLYAGDDSSFTLAVKNADGSPANLVGATVLSQIRQTPQTAAVAATFTTSISGNVITLGLAHTAAAGLGGSYVWDCQVTYASGQVQTIAAGQCRITAEVSH